MNSISENANPRVLFFNGEAVNLYRFSKEHPEFSLFVIKGTWYNASLFAAVIGDDINDTDQALNFSYSDTDFDVVDKNDLNIGKVGGFI